jgi:hypothetical protein
MGKNSTQIPNELWYDILRFHLVGLHDDEVEQHIFDGICRVVEAQTRHELYTKFKTAPTEAQREQARQDYLNRAGIPTDFRW